MKRLFNVIRSKFSKKQGHSDHWYDRLREPQGEEFDFSPLTPPEKRRIPVKRGRDGKSSAAPGCYASGGKGGAGEHGGVGGDAFASGESSIAIGGKGGSSFSFPSDFGKGSATIMTTNPNLQAYLVTADGQEVRLAEETTSSGKSFLLPESADGAGIRFVGGGRRF